jgi:hypothetical protein
MVEIYTRRNLITAAAALTTAVTVPFANAAELAPRSDPYGDALTAPRLTKNVLLGEWKYQSIKKEPVDYDAEKKTVLDLAHWPPLSTWITGKLTVEERAGLLVGQLQLIEDEGIETLRLSIDLCPENASIRMTGDGTSKGALDWHTDYYGMLLPTWIDGRLNTGPALAGTNIRATSNRSGPAGYVALWCAVKIS